MNSNSMSTPWGGSQSRTFYDPQRTIMLVNTAEHGGFGVHVSREMPKHLVTGIAIVEDTWRWFEEDQAWAAVAVAFPEFFSEANVASAQQTLKDWYPEAYMAHFGVNLTAADSRKLEQLAWEEATRDNFVVTAGWGDWAWDVPAGHVYAAGFRARDGAAAGFLVPQDQYERPGRMVLDSFPRWEPDRTKPYCKPRLAECAA